MSCPFDESIILDYLEGELEGESAREIEKHLAGCSHCREKYDSLLRARKVLGTAARELKIDDPGETFWQQNARKIAQATFRKKDTHASTGKVLFLRRSVVPLLAAAAVLLLIFTGQLEWIVRHPLSQEKNGRIQQENLTYEMSLEDSLYIIQKRIQEYRMAAMALESIGELGAIPADEFPAENITFTAGRSVYEGLLELDDEELDDVMLLLASI